MERIHPPCQRAHIGAKYMECCNVNFCCDKFHSKKVNVRKYIPKIQGEGKRKCIKHYTGV